jgi:hypothetical protein
MADSQEDYPDSGDINITNTGVEKLSSLVSQFLLYISNMPGTSKVSPEQRTRVQMSPEAQNDIKMHFYDFYQINLYNFNKFQIYFINYSGF